MFNVFVQSIQIVFVYLLVNLRKIHEKYDEDPCSICMEVVNIIYPRTFRRSQCCGKVMHLACATQLITSELSVEQRYSMVRACF